VEYAVEVTPGPHQWASAEVCSRAVEWLELDAMKKGLRPKDQELIDAVYDKMVQRGDELEKEGWPYYAAALYRYALPLLSGLKDTADLETRLTRIQAGQEYEEFLTAETKRNRQEIDLIGRFAFVFSLARNTAPGQIRFPQVAKDLQIANLVKMEADKTDIFTGAMARRLLLELLLKGRDEGEAHLRKGDAQRAALFFEITIAAGTENVNNYYNLACAYALTKDKKKALKSLQKAIDLGFSDLALLESDKMLDSLRQDKAFIALAQAMREKN
jgi:tetratricopeptide (TPR) repeat protein